MSPLMCGIYSIQYIQYIQYTVIFDDLVFCLFVVTELTIIGINVHWHRSLLIVILIPRIQPLLVITQISLTLPIPKNPSSLSPN